MARSKGALKALELAWKEVWLTLVTSLVRLGGRPATPLPGPDQPCRVLFLRPDRIGDAIVSTGIFREIVTRSPQVVLDVLCSPVNAPALASDPHVSAIHVFDRRNRRGYLSLIRQLRTERYDAVIDCMVTAPSMTCLLLMVASGARHRIGMGGRGIDRALTVPVEPVRDGTHIIELLAAFGTVFGVPPGAADWSPRLYVAEEAERRALRLWETAQPSAGDRILVNVSAGKPARNWPEERFVQAIRHLEALRPGAAVLIVGSPAELDRVERIAAAARVRSAPTPTLEDVIALVGTATFLLTPDTSVAHMASALRTPAVVMYLPGTSAMWALYGTEGVCLESTGPSLASLPLDEVLRAVEEVLGPAHTTH